MSFMPMCGFELWSLHIYGTPKLNQPHHSGSVILCGFCGVGCGFEPCFVEMGGVKSF